MVGVKKFCLVKVKLTQMMKINTKLKELKKPVLTQPNDDYLSKQKALKELHDKAMSVETQFIK